jgi:hypothetical protein
MVRQSVAEILQDHVTYELEAIDRMYLNAHVPSLQTGAGFVYFLKTQLQAPVASTVMVAPMSQRFVQALERFAAAEGVDLVTFERGQRKDEVAQRYLATFEGDEGVLFIGKAQEKAQVFRTTKAGMPAAAIPGSSARRRWSIIITSTWSTAISARCSSSSARTSRTPRSSV